MVTKSPSGDVFDIQAVFISRDGEKSVTFIIDGRAGALTFPADMEYLGEWKTFPPDAHGKQFRIRVSQSTAKQYDLLVFRIPGMKTKGV